MAMHGHSAACCSIPPIEHDYTGKGEYTTADGLKTYVTGPASSKTGVVVVYDIFGYKAQNVQGADIVGNSGVDEAHRYRVFVPDFLDGTYADLSWLPPDTEEKGAKLGEFFKTAADPGKAAKRMGPVVADLKAKNPAITKWAVVGFCWGGKIVALTAGADTPFVVAAVAHPAMVDPSEAPGITIPYALIPSGDENMDDVNAFAKALKVDHEVKQFPDQIHGFMGARADLKDPNVAKKYQEGYQVMLEWL